MSSLLITGGTGTLGHAIVRDALQSTDWERVIVYSRDEVKQAQMTARFGHYPAFRAFLGDVRDYDRLCRACSGVDVVVAAAALKRVESTAYNPDELLKTNVIGIENTIRAAATEQVPRVVVVSSDKACEPTNPYGVSKAMAETLAVTSNAWAYRKGTKICAVRYGNVLDSRGSVLETWRQQAATGGPLTITDSRMTRFILTVAQAVGVISYAVDNMDGGEIFVPILPSAHVVDLAEACAPGVERRETGLRPGGEKLAESLLTSEEAWRTYQQDETMYVVTPSMRSWSSTPWEGVPVARTLRYRSDENMHWLTVAQLRALMPVVAVDGV